MVRNFIFLWASSFGLFFLYACNSKPCLSLALLGTGQWKDPSKKQIKFLTYNVWRREDVVLYKRMKAIGDLVEKLRT